MTFEVQMKEMEQKTDHAWIKAYWGSGASDGNGASDK